MNIYHRFIILHIKNYNFTFLFYLKIEEIELKNMYMINQYIHIIQQYLYIVYCISIIQDHQCLI